MTKDEAIKYLIQPFCTSTVESEEYRKQREAYTMAIESLKTEAIPVEWVEEWIYKHMTYGIPDQMLNEWLAEQRK